MVHCEYKLAKANTEEELENAVREASREGWYRSSPNRTAGDVPVESLHYCVLSRIQPTFPRRAGPVLSFFEVRQNPFWRS